MTQRVYNFSPGPAVLPVAVLKEAQRDLVALPGVGMSVLEVSHRSKWYTDIQKTAESNLRRLLGISEAYAVLFLQGGAVLQFSMVPMNLLAGGSADYLITGSWGKKAYEEAGVVGRARIAYSAKDHKFTCLPTDGEIEIDTQASYAHYTANETIHGVQFRRTPQVGDVPLVCDASSEFLSRPMAIERHGLIYACAQKNAGPAGVTIVIVRRDLLERAPQSLPSILSYRTHAENDSKYNTPPVFAVYMVMLVTRWLLDEVGGLEAMAARNADKARILYDALDDSECFYRAHAQLEARSLMNVTFRLPSEELEKRFISEAASQGLFELAGHRSVGGIRASIYNAMPREGVQALAEFMQRFRQHYAQ